MGAENRYTPICAECDIVKLTFTSTGFVLCYPPGWRAQALPDQIAGTQIVEFAHSTPAGRVDASIQVFETWLLPGEDWEQDPEIKFWRKRGTQAKYRWEQVLVNGQPGWMMSMQPPIQAGDLVRAVFVAQDGRLYRFRMYLYQSDAVESHMRTFALMMGKLQIAERVVRPVIPTPSAPTQEIPQTAPASLATATLSYNRGLAYAYAEAWWDKKNNSDGCYLWYTDTAGLACEWRNLPGEYGVDGAHFVNRAVWAGGRPISQLVIDYRVRHKNSFLSIPIKSY